MATSDNEYYWRIYLLHHEGSSLISKQVLSREVKKCGGDLDNLLLKNKKQLIKIVSTSEADILFPKTKKTDIEQWETDLLLRVILILFSKTLPKSDRQHIRRIQNVQNHISSLPEQSLDPEAYDDLTESLSQAVRELARVLSKETETKISELVNVFIDEPFNVENMINTILNLPKEIQLKLAVFLQSRKSVSEEKKRVDVILYERTRDAHPKDPTGTQLDSGNKHKRKTGDSDDISRGSDDGTMDTNLSDVIVQNVGQGLTKEEAREWKEAEIEMSMKRKSFDKSAKDKLQKWEDEVVKVAVLGRTGTGKSLFINVFRGCTSKTDPLYAKVGSTETTATATCYTHPTNNKLKLYDIPGMGTSRFPRETYMSDKRIDFHSYDIYLIMSSDRFTQDDAFLAAEIEKMGKLYLFVRTRVDINLADVDDEKAEIVEIRADCEKNLAEMRIKTKDVYLISSKRTDHPLLDWEKLFERLIDGLPRLKKEALIVTLQHQTLKFIEGKEEILWKRTINAAVMYAAGEALTVPGLSFAVDLSLICNELDLYRQILGITDKDLTDLAEKTNKGVDELKREHKLESFDLCKFMKKEATQSYVQIGPILTRIAASEAVGTSSKVLSVIGCAVGTAVSEVTTVCFLRSYLKKMVEDAKTMMAIRVGETSKKVLSSGQI